MDEKIDMSVLELEASVTRLDTTEVDSDIMLAVSDTP